MCAHTYTAMPETHTNWGHGLACPLSFPCPMLILVSVKRFFFSSFPFLTFQCEHFDSKLRLSSCSLETSQPILNYKLFSPSRFKKHNISLRKRTLKKQLSPLAQSVSKKASKMNSTIFRALMLSKDNFMSPKSERHAVTVTHVIHTSPRRIMLKDLEGKKTLYSQLFPESLLSKQINR